MRLANEVREAGMPVYCSACHDQDNKLRYVDFDAACDRGYGNEEAVKITFDDLIVCERCVTLAGKTIGLEDTAELKQRVKDLEDANEVQFKKRRQAETYAENMEQALATRVEKGKPAPVGMDHRQKPRQVKVHA